MELSALLFSLGLFLAGVWLIFSISGDFKAKRKQEQRAAEPPRRNPRAARHVSPVAPKSAADSSRQPSAAPPSGVADASPPIVQKTVPPDPFKDLDAAAIHDTFERFTSESKRTR